MQASVEAGTDTSKLALVISRLLGYLFAAGILTEEEREEEAVIAMILRLTK